MSCSAQQGVNILKDYQGIIGTVTGFIVSFLTTFILKRTGKITFSYSNLVLKKLARDKYGGYQSSKILKLETERIEVYFDAYFFNNKEIPTGLKDISLNFYAETKPIKKSLGNHKTKEGIIKKIDLPSKTLINIAMYCIIDDKKIIESINKGVLVYFEAYFPNNKLYKQRIHYLNSQDIEKPEIKNENSGE